MTPGSTKRLVYRSRYGAVNLDVGGLPRRVAVGAQTVAPVRVLVITGGHSYPTAFYTVFEQPGIAWDHAVSSEEAYRDDLRDRYDVLVLHDMPKTLSAAGQQHLRAFAESGKGWSSYTTPSSATRSGTGIAT